MNAYDKQPFSIGNEILHARPIEWDREDEYGTGIDIDNKPIIPVKFEMACGKCGQMIILSLSDALEIDGLFVAVCPICKAGKEQYDDCMEILNSIGVNSIGGLSYQAGLQLLETSIDFDIMVALGIQESIPKPIKMEIVEAGTLDFELGLSISAENLDHNMMSDDNLDDAIIVT